MMKKFFNLSFISILFQLSVFASSDFQPVVDSSPIEKKVAEVKAILKSKEWVPTDSAAYNRLVSLLYFIENPAPDSVIEMLSQDINRDVPLFVRTTNRTKNISSLKGFITSTTITQKLKDIEDEIRFGIPSSSIIVPEEVFLGMSTKLPLVSQGNTQQLIEESLVEIPDSILLLFSTPKKIKNEKARFQLDSFRNAYLDSVRVAYNNRLIQKYKDSISQVYRENYLYQIIKEAQLAYTDSVNALNQKVLKIYNDTLSSNFNNNLKEDISDLIDYANRIPYPLIISNLKRESATFNLEEGKRYYQWVWLKNFQNDSIGIKIENIDRHNIRILIDESVNLSRLSQNSSMNIDRVAPRDMMPPVQLKKMPERKMFTKPWTLGGKAYVGISQTYINDFWAQGGSKSASVLGTFNYSANYSKKKVKWENSLDAKLGLIYYVPQDDSDSDVVRNWLKNSDNFDITSKLGISAFKKWNYTTELTFKTQSFVGYKSQTDTIVRSAPLSPAYLNFAIGLDYTPNKNLSLILSPISLKTTYVINSQVDETTYGLEEGQTRSSNIGPYIKLEHSRNLMEDISMKTTNSVFINLQSSEIMKIPDIDSETTFNFKVNQFISTQLNAHFIYDKSVVSEWTDADGADQTGTKLQVKEFFTLGVSYKF